MNITQYATTKFPSLVDIRVTDNLGKLVNSISAHFPELNVYGFLSEYIEETSGGYRCKRCGVCHESYDTMVAHVGGAHDSNIVLEFFEKFGIFTLMKEYDGVQILGTLLEDTHKYVGTVQHVPEEIYVGDIVIRTQFDHTKFKLARDGLNVGNTEYTDDLRLQVRSTTFSNIVDKLALVLSRVTVQVSDDERRHGTKEEMTEAVRNTLSRAVEYVKSMYEDRSGESEIHVSNGIVTVDVEIEAITMDR